jgi:Fe2+ or Zn2+ uptake regulation protein
MAQPPVAVHDVIDERLSSADQRYTAGRRAIVDALLAAARPLTVPEIVDTADTKVLPQSSAYRNLAVLLDAGVVHRLPGANDHDRFELAENIVGHHHHLRCVQCGLVVDVIASPGLEDAVVAAARRASRTTGFEVTGHHVDLIGRCHDCRA